MHARFSVGTWRGGDVFTFAACRVSGQRRVRLATWTLWDMAKQRSDRLYGWKAGRLPGCRGAHVDIRARCRLGSGWRAHVISGVSGEVRRWRVRRVTTWEASRPRTWSDASMGSRSASELTGCARAEWVHWQDGESASRSREHIGEWRCDGVIVWRAGRLAGLPCGGMARRGGARLAVCWACHVTACEFGDVFT